MQILQEQISVHALVGAKVIESFRENYTTTPLREAVFKILEEVAPTKTDGEETKVVSINKGRPGS